MIGLERETLRVTKTGDLSKEAHPPRFGSPLTHKSLTLDFAEAQPELVTPPFDSQEDALTYLQDLQSWVEQDSHLWPLSMPCRLPDENEIAIATFGDAQKELYRLGLSHRYDFKMQLISGVHLNFSFAGMEVDDYFSLMRNALRHGWIVTYLFGASPAADLSYFSTTPDLQKWDASTYYGKYATSLRMSCYGYYSKVQQQLAISYNSYDEYKRDLALACKTVCPCYISIGENQISDAYLQIPAEHYSRIRPKQNGENFYIECRGLDLDPFFPTGIDPNTVSFIGKFLLWCAKIPSPPLTPEEMQQLTENQNRVALFGRKDDLKLWREKKEIPLTSWRDELLRELGAPLTKPKSAQILDAMKGMSHIDFGLALSQKHHMPKPSEKFDAMAINSLERSTQLVIAEAKRRNLPITIVDGKKSHICIDGELIKQATITSRDSDEVLSLLQDKKKTKEILRKANLRVPEEKTSPTCDLVVKPNSTNFGDGISFVQKGDEKGLAKAIAIAKTYDDDVIVEEKVHGDEYRFLVIGGQVIAVAKRLPAHVIGDGKSTLLKLAEAKREEQRKTRPEKECIRLSDVTTPTAIPKKGELIFLRLNTNVSTGGEAIDVTDTIDKMFIEIAEKAAKTMGATITGIDMIIDGDSYAILEANHNPHLALHVTPETPQNVAKSLLDFLGFPDPQEQA